MAELIQGNTGEWEMVIGLEVHAQVISKAKLFSGAATDFGAEPNSQVSLVDAAMPGMLPVINEACVEQAVRTGLGLGAEINLVSVFDRKNYFYPDLPQGYQISQFPLPIVGRGTLTLDLEDGGSREIGITRLHLEQDAGKSLHDQDPRRTYVDLNRSGVALMEIVSEPDLRSAAEAGAYVRKLRSILRYLGTCDGNMEEGSMRADVNVSVRRAGENEYGTRCEIKNLNSVRFIEQAIEVEARRQVALIEEGGEVAQETRLFDSAKGLTRPMRSKEEAHDYRYFPDPDLLPLVLDEAWVAEIEKTLPELPDIKKKRFVDEFGLSAYAAGVLVAEKEVADFFEGGLKKRNLFKLYMAQMAKQSQVIPDVPVSTATSTANWVTGELFGALNSAGIDISESPVSNEGLARLLDLIDEDIISGRSAKDVFEIMFRDSRDDPETIVAEQGLKQVSDSGAIEAIIDKIVADNPGQVEAYKKNPKVAGWFVGQVMKQTGGKANPKTVNELLARKLSP